MMSELMLLLKLVVWFQRVFQLSMPLVSVAFPRLVLPQKQQLLRLELVLECGLAQFGARVGRSADVLVEGPNGVLVELLPLVTLVWIAEALRVVSPPSTLPVHEQCHPPSRFPMS
jgi:hypothetical protein